MISARRPIVINAHVIWALMLRESRMAFGTSHWGYLWAVLQPAVTLSFLIIIFVLIGRGAPFGESLGLFFATSLLCQEYFNKLSVSLMRSFSSNKSLFAYPPVQTTDTVIARLLLVSSVHVLVGALFYTSLYLTGYGAIPWRPELVILAFVMIGLFGLGIGMINAVIYSFFSSWQHFEKLFGRPLLFMSGTFYVPSMLPPEAISIIKWNPIIHMVEINRMGFYADYHSEILDPLFIGFAIGGVLVVAMFAERFTRKMRK
ncbi:ABC transporter permease [Pararhodobacter oceanensis]|uniref:ABC transporter n=1 Tax=Pararhodobacter oceanensis TaxID=2172121 RepID=A0A2T8HPE0_9RHOB|nr:ABC transporter permease [Pararhodobacter oceanensis]PVH27273.1 ABC transporter [Pararhodobacter oceanensis]